MTEATVASACGSRPNALASEARTGIPHLNPLKLTVFPPISVAASCRRPSIRFQSSTVARTSASTRMVATNSRGSGPCGTIS